MVRSMETSNPWCHERDDFADLIGGVLDEAARLRVCCPQVEESRRAAAEKAKELAGFDEVLEEYERNCQLRLDDHRRRQLGAFATVLSRETAGELVAMTGRLSAQLDALVERQVELCARLAAPEEEEEDARFLEVHAAHQAAVLSAFARLAVFVSRLQRHCAAAGRLPELVERLEAALSEAKAHEGPTEDLKSRFESIEAARAVLQNLTCARSALQAK